MAVAFKTAEDTVSSARLEEPMQEGGKFLDHISTRAPHMFAQGALTMEVP